jgi:hypothetical protein
VFKLSVSRVTRATATLTVSPRKASVGSTVIRTGRATTFEVRAKARKGSEVSSVFLENFSIKPRNSEDFFRFRGYELYARPASETKSTCEIVVVYVPDFVTSKGQFDTAMLELPTNAEETKPAASSGVIDVTLKGKCRLFHRRR